MISYAKERNISNITFLAPISKKSIPKLGEYFTIGYCSARESSLYRYGISMNKIYDYMYMGIPVLLSFHASENLIEKYECGLVSDAIPKKISETVEKFYNLKQDDLDKMGRQGKKIIETQYMISILARKFLKEIEQK